MNKFNKQLLSVFATGAVLLNTISPVFAETTIEISGNGADSTNKAYVDMDKSTNVVQSNSADVYNKVDADANTGDNSAKKNTGGDVSIETGDATTDVKVENTLNSNTASVDCCAAGDVDVLISGNGAGSNNKADLDVNQEKGSQYSTGVFQTNTAEVKNKVYTDADTGDNKAKENTGGDVSIKTGDAEATVNVSTAANANWAKVGGGDNQGGTLSMRILGNGADSTNKIYLDFDNVIALQQDNAADVYNKVDADANTGDNSAKENTGGEVSIETGDATTDVGIDNMVNFNWADVDCGCLFDVLAKVAGNGADSYNKIKADFDDELLVFQGNCVNENGSPRKDCEVDNKVYTDADSGDNKAKENTGDPGSDPSITTGDAEATVDVNNAGNSNVYGSQTPSDWPEFDFNFNVSLSWSQLLALLGLAG